MSPLSRALSPSASHPLAEFVRAILSNPDGRAAPALPGAAADPPAPAASTGPVAPRRIVGPTGLGTSAAQILPTTRAGAPVPELYCPPALRDDPALGEAVNERLIEWAAQIGIYPGRVDHLRAANFGRLIMLAHPETDDPDRLLAAAKCALAEWASDDYYVDTGEAEADLGRLGQRLAIAYAAVDPAHLPVRYAPQLDETLRSDPVRVAYSSSLDHLARYATGAQLARLRHELAVMFVAFNQEGVWRTTGHTPPVWEYLMHRHENSFLPCMSLVDVVAGYEVPPAEFADARVRRAFTMAGTASVILNDLYSMTKDGPTDMGLPKVIAAEEGCTLPEAVQRAVDVHDELVHTFETEAAALSLLGSPALRRFLAGTWAWLGGNREWHRGSDRYLQPA